MRLGLLLAELGQKAEVTVTDAEMTQAIMTKRASTRVKSVSSLNSFSKTSRCSSNCVHHCLKTKWLDHVVEQATVAEKEVSKEDLQKAVEALEEE